MPGKPSTLAGFYNLIGAAAAGVAVVSGIAAVITFFATKTELNQLSEKAQSDLQAARTELLMLTCQAMARLDLVDANTKRLYADQAAFNAKLVLVKNTSSETDRERLKQLIKGHESDIEIAQQQQVEANRRLSDCNQRH